MSLPGLLSLEPSSNNGIQYGCFIDIGYRTGRDKCMYTTVVYCCHNNKRVLIGRCQALSIFPLLMRCALYEYLRDENNCYGEL